MPEIFMDEFYFAIKDCVKKYRPKTILEIGSWDGTGSTRAFVEGITEGVFEGIFGYDQVPKLYCLEAQKDRYDSLVKNMQGFPFVKCYYKLKKNFRPEYPKLTFITLGRKQLYKKFQLFQILKYPDSVNSDITKPDFYNW